MADTNFLGLAISACLVTLIVWGTISSFKAINNQKKDRHDNPQANDVQSWANELARRKADSTAGILACVFAVLGIFALSIIFVPIATILAAFGTSLALKYANWSGVGINVLAWVLIIFAFVTSPVLLSTLFGSAVVL